MPKTYVIIPTYNEAENIEALLREIIKLNVTDLTALVVDDNSPDGTGGIAEKLAKENSSIKVLRRFKNRGRGSAGIDGFKYALKEGASYIIEMDADFSHRPKYLPVFLENIKIYDLVLGSRFIPGGKDAERSFFRRLITSFARLYIQSLLGLKVKDVTSGYRCFRSAVLAAIDLDHLISTGPSIISEILYQAALKNYKIHEIPIIFEDRKKGKTKLNLWILLKTLYMVYRFRKIYGGI